MEDLFSEEARQTFAPKPLRSSSAAAASGASAADAGADGDSVAVADGGKKHKRDSKSRSGATADAGKGAGSSRSGGASRVGEEEADSRTVFASNVPTATKEGELKKLFAPFGKVVSVRRRSIPITGAKVRFRRARSRKCMLVRRAGGGRQGGGH